MSSAFSPLSFIIGAVIGVLLTGGWMTFDSYRPAVSKFPPQEAASAALLESGAIEVFDQAAGSSVRVETVTVPPPGVWVAVRETAGEELGNVLGASRVSGPQTEVFVQLLRETIPGRTYAVELYRDDNAGVFDPGANSVYVDFDTGERVVERFRTEE